MLRTRIIFLSGIPNIFLSIFLHLHESGSLTSNTSTIISQAYINFFISLWYLFESWWDCTFYLSPLSYYSIGYSYYFYCYSRKWCKCNFLYDSRFEIVWVRYVYLFLSDWRTFCLNFDRSGGRRDLSTKLYKEYIFWMCHEIFEFFVIFDLQYCLYSNYDWFVYDPFWYCWFLILNKNYYINNSFINYIFTFYFSIKRIINNKQ